MKPQQPPGIRRVGANSDSVYWQMSGGATSAATAARYPPLIFTG